MQLTVTDPSDVDDELDGTDNGWLPFCDGCGSQSDQIVDTESGAGLCPPCTAKSAGQSADSSAAGGTRTVPGRPSFRPHEPEPWGDRPVHDLMTEMAPDLAASVRTMEALGTAAPEGVNTAQWRTDLKQLRRSFELMDNLKDASFFSDADEAEFATGMNVLRTHAADGRITAHLSPTVTPALRAFAEASEKRPSYPVVYVSSPDTWISDIRACADGFEHARTLDSTSRSEDREQVEDASDWLADNYLSLWS